MLVLQRLSEVVPAPILLSRWTGPAGGLHDITDNDWAIEIKTYSAEPPRPRISDIAQLDHDIDKRLTLVAHHIAGANEGRTFPEFVAEATEWSRCSRMQRSSRSGLGLGGLA